MVLENGFEEEWFRVGDDFVECFWGMLFGNAFGKFFWEILLGNTLGEYFWGTVLANDLRYTFRECFLRYFSFYSK